MKMGEWYSDLPSGYVRFERPMVLLEWERDFILEWLDLIRRQVEGGDVRSSDGGSEVGG